MKVSIDVDGVITHHPMFFLGIAVYMRAWGHTVGVLSSRHSRDIPPGPWEFIIGNDENIQGGKYANATTEDMARWKAEQVRKNDIDIHFDDCADLINRFDVGTTKVLKVVP